MKKGEASLKRLVPSITLARPIVPPPSFLLYARRFLSRLAPTLDSLIATQNALRSSEGCKGPLSVSSVKEFNDFFLKLKRKQAKSNLQDELNRLLKSVSQNTREDELFPAEVDCKEGEDKNLPVFIAALDTSGGDAALKVYSASKNVMVGSYTIKQLEGDFWDDAGYILSFISNSAKQFILLPLVATKEDRKRVGLPVELFVKALKKCGIQCFGKLDTLAVKELLSSRSGSPDSISEKAGSSDRDTALTARSFEKCWSLLCSSICHVMEEDPLAAVNLLVAPRFDVLVCHIVRTGSQGLSIAVWNPMRKKRYGAKGMLSDILSCLIQVGSSSMILIPTARTDRLLLYQCSTAMRAMDKMCVICFSTALHEKCRTVFHADPEKLWNDAVQFFQSVEADLLFRTYECAGDAVRAGYEKLWSEKRIEKYTKRHDEAASLPIQKHVTLWQQVFKHPRRAPTEAKERKKYVNFVVVAYTSTEHTAYCQPRNPIAGVNYIISAAVADSKGHVLEPWVKYENRKNSFQFPSLDEYDVLVAHDAKRLMLLCSEDAELQKFIRRGGRVWCIMLAEYLLEAQRCNTGNNTISGILLCYGIVVAPGSVVGTGPELLPLSFHRRHLLAAVRGVGEVFRKQVVRGQEQLQLVSLSHRMDALIAMAHMESNGICIDAEEADRQNNSIRNSVVVMDHALEAHAPPEVPSDMRSLFDWGSVSHVQALFFGGTIHLGDSSSPKARESAAWISHLMHFLYRYGSLEKLNNDHQLELYAKMFSLPPGQKSTKLSSRVAKHLEKSDHAKKSFRIIVFDVETTGLNAATDEIIELALYDPVEDASFRSLVKPSRRITPRTISIHHITEEEVRTAPSPKAVMRNALQFLRLGANRGEHEILVMVGHNVFSLDEPMLRREITRYTGDATVTEGILFCDSLALLRAHKSNLQRKSSQAKEERSNRKEDRRVLEALNASLRLSDLTQRLGVVPKGDLHRAETDTRALWNVLGEVFRVSTCKPREQCTHILAQAANTFLKYPSAGCFVPQLRIGSAVQVKLPGIAKKHMPNTVALNGLRKRGISDETLATLSAHGVEAAGLLLKRQRLERLTPRFLESNDFGHTTMHPDRRIRQHIDMTHTVTSRTSSAFPSCQNIAKEGPVRRLFVSRFGASGRCVEVDYSQLEIVILAILSKDAKLVKDLQRGVDFHIKRAEFFSGIPYQQIEEGCRRGEPKYVKLRKMAKQFSFQRLYGAGISLLHRTTGIPVKDLQKSVELEEKAYPGISEFYRAVRAVALRPDNPGLPAVHIVELPTGLRIGFKARDVVINLPPVKNYPIQAYGSEIAQMMLGRLLRHFLKSDCYDQRAVITNFVHDSVWLDCHVDVLEKCVRDTCRIMGSAHEYIPKVFPGVELQLPLKVSASCGPDMQHMKTVEWSS